MHYLGLLPRLLLRLPSQLRLIIVIFTFLSSSLLFAFGFPDRLNGSLLGIPIALAVWLFKRPGAQIGLTSTLLVIFLVNTFTLHSIIWPHAILISFLSGALTLIIITLIMYYLRNASDISDAARLKSQQAQQQLELTYKKEKQLNQLKDQLLVSINHELRTPLTGALGYLELLLDFEGELDALTHNIFLKNAFRNCQELQFLVNNVLDAVNADKKYDAILTEKVAVLAVVWDILEQFDPRAREEHPVSVDIAEYLTVYANKQYLHQILRNLLSNAFKYSPKSSPVNVSATHLVSGEDKEDTILISVKDVGPGIPPEELPLLFGQFVRLKRDISGSTRGTGLGLYVSKQLVQEMRGTIWVESSGVDGEGSRFCFTLPASTNEEISL